MKIIGQTGRDFIAIVNRNEIDSLLQCSYSQTPDVQIGDTIDANALSQAVADVRGAQDRLTKMPQTLRTLADVIEREIQIVTPTEPPKPEVA